MNSALLLQRAKERLTQPLDLTEFDERFREEDGAPMIVAVWVNPTVEQYREWNRIEDAEERGKVMLGERIGLPRGETLELFEQDAAFGAWLAERVMEISTAYAEGRRKKSQTD